jgi:hypothetical protein
VIIDISIAREFINNNIPLLERYTYNILYGINSKHFIHNDITYVSMLWGVCRDSQQGWPLLGNNPLSIFARLSGHVTTAALARYRGTHYVLFCGEVWQCCHDVRHQGDSAVTVEHVIPCHPHQQRNCVFIRSVLRLIWKIEAQRLGSLR